MEEDGQAMNSNPGVPLGQDKKNFKNQDKNQDKQDKKTHLNDKQDDYHLSSLKHVT